MRWLVTGAAGQLGTDVTAVLKMYGEDVVPCGRGMLDISEPDSVQSVLDDASPDVVINCTGLTAGEPDALRSANVGIVVKLVDALEGRTGVHLVQLGSDGEPQDPAKFLNLAHLVPVVRQ